MILGNPRGEALHVPDVVKLVASGGSALLA